MDARAGEMCRLWEARLRRGAQLEAVVSGSAAKPAGPGLTQWLRKGHTRCSEHGLVGQLRTGVVVGTTCWCQLKKKKYLNKMESIFPRGWGANIPLSALIYHEGVTSWSLAHQIHNSTCS